MPDILPAAKKIALALDLKDYNILQVRLAPYVLSSIILAAVDDAASH